MLLKMSYCFKIAILAEICIKKRYFYCKIAKIARVKGFATSKHPTIPNPI